MSAKDRSSRRRAAPRGASAGEREFDSKRGVFMISVAAELAEMHPQTLRMYEARGLITPKRSPKNTRLYSFEDVERLRQIQRMTEEGLNLLGVETVLEMESELRRAREELGRMRRRMAAAEREMLEEVERAKRSLRGEIVPYGAYETRLLPDDDASRIKIPVKRVPRRGGPQHRE